MGPLCPWAEQYLRRSHFGLASCFSTLNSVTIDHRSVNKLFFYNKYCLIATLSHSTILSCHWLWLEHCLLLVHIFSFSFLVTEPVVYVFLRPSSCVAYWHSGWALLYCLAVGLPRWLVLVMTHPQRPPNARSRSQTNRLQLSVLVAMATPHPWHRNHVL